MTKEKVKDLFAVFIRVVYDEAGLVIPKHFDPEPEAKRVASALIAKGLGIEVDQ